MNTKTKSTTKSGSIFARDGQWYMQCGHTAVPIRLLDKDGREIPAPQAAPEGETAEEEQHVN